MTDKHAAVKAKILSVYAQHKGRYGYRRITVALRQRGDVINHKTVQRLMQTLGLRSLVRPKKYRSYRGEVGRVAPNLLDRQFNAMGPGQKRSEEHTYELQSLMRISYAVFCLKKKTRNTKRT